MSDDKTTSEGTSNQGMSANMPVVIRFCLFSSCWFFGPDAIYSRQNALGIEVTGLAGGAYANIRDLVFAFMLMHIKWLLIQSSPDE